MLTRGTYFFLCFSAFLLSINPAANADRRVALVIGNGSYVNANQLPNPRNDAEDVGLALKRLGFETIVGVDLDQSKMQQMTIDFARAARESDVALFYYSGHAMQFAGVNYLMPVDAKLTDEADLRRMTRVDEIIEDLKQAKSLRVLILDACRDNPFAEELKRSIGRARAFSLQRGLAKIDAPEGVIISFSTQAGQTADDGSGRNSPYTTAFLKHIDDQDEIGSVFRRISKDVYEATAKKQLPELSFSMIGEYYFRAPPESSTPAVQPEQTVSSPPTSESASEAWKAAKESESIQVLEAFIARFDGSFYAEMAKARLSELKSAALEKEPAVDGESPREQWKKSIIELSGRMVTKSSLLPLCLLTMRKPQEGWRSLKRGFLMSGFIWLAPLDPTKIGITQSRLAQVSATMTQPNSAIGPSGMGSQRIPISICRLTAPNAYRRNPTKAGRINVNSASVLAPAQPVDP